MKGAFIFLASQGNKERAWVKTNGLDLVAVAVKDYDEAVAVARSLLEEGIVAIELCAGFGHKGTAKVAEAVGDKVPVGVVRFDIHPGLEGKSGDLMF